MATDALMQMITQVVDDVSFSQTHTISEDFRVYPKTSMESVSTLQQEQRKRVEQTYGARAPSPDFLGSQLLAEYRGEAASLQLAKESGDPNFPTSISRMTSDQSKQFKKDMKQRIHEWESTVRDATGQPDVFPDQKASLRSIYELYRATKMKVLGVEAPPAHHGGSVATTATASEAPAGGAGRDVSQSVAATVAGGAPSPAPESTRSESQRTGSAKESTITASTTAAGAAAAPSSANSAGAKAGAAGRVAPGSTPEWMLKIERVPLGTTEVGTMSDDALQTEKRTLKQVLHRFESDFEKYNRVRPGRHDRHGFTGEYHRYGELKNELTRRGQK